MTIQRSHAFLPVMADSHSNSPRLQGEPSFALLFAIRSSLSFFIVADSHSNMLGRLSSATSPTSSRLTSRPLTRL